MRLVTGGQSQTPVAGVLGAMAGGDEAGAAFSRVYEAYGARVYGFLFRLAGTRDRADDLFQETWLRVARAWAGRNGVGPADEAAWLFTIARNVFRSERRAAATSTRAVAELQLVSDTPPADPEGAAAVQQAAAQLERAFARLSDDDRAVLWLIGVEGLEQRQVALVLQIGYAAVRQRLARARARLAAELAGPGDDGEPGLAPAAQEGRGKA